MNTQGEHKRSGFKTSGGVFIKITGRSEQPENAGKGSKVQNVDQRDMLTNGDPPKLMLWGSDE